MENQNEAIEQEVEITFEVSSDFFDMHTEKTLPDALEQYKQQEHATFEIISLLNTKLVIKVNTSIRASWDIKNNNRWAHAVWSMIFKPFEKDIIWGPKMVTILEEKDIYGNK